MKVRMGFVSNSSSSSFVILARDIGIKDISKVKGTVAFTVDGCDGKQYVELDDEMTKYILKNTEDFAACAFYEVFAECDEQGDGEVNIDKSIIPNTGAKLIVFDMDQNSPQTLGDIKSKEFKDSIKDSGN